MKSSDATSEKRGTMEILKNAVSELCTFLCVCFGDFFPFAVLLFMLYFTFDIEIFEILRPHMIHPLYSIDYY